MKLFTFILVFSAGMFFVTGEYLLTVLMLIAALYNQKELLFE